MQRAASTPLRILAALLLGVVLCELGLRAAAWIAQRDLERGGLSGDPAIACYGDSNVFGLYETAEDAYPGRLEAWIAKRPAGGPPVVNRGLPGLSTRHVLARVRGDLAHANPAAVLVTAGVNNHWAWLADASVEAARPPWYEELRIVRLLRLLRATTATPQGSARGEHRVRVDAETGVQTAHMTDRDGEEWIYAGRSEGLGDERFAESIRADLTELHQSLDAAGVPLVIVTYGSEHGVYGAANAALRAFAEEARVPLVETTTALATLTAQRGFDEVFYRDQHPRAIGYEVIARLVHDHLTTLGILPGPALGDPLADLASTAPAATPVVRLEGRLDAAPGTAGELRACASGGEPGREFSLVLWGLRPPGTALEWMSFDELRATDPLFGVTSREPRMTGRFDHNGEACLALGFLTDLGTSLERFSGQNLRACYLVYTPGVRDGVARISREVDLVLP